MKIGRDACFLVTKAAEQFLERATWDAARSTIRNQRKTIAHRDVVASMREHANPESMQIFYEVPSRVPLRTVTRVVTRVITRAVTRAVTHRYACRYAPLRVPLRAPLRVPLRVP